MNPDLVPLPVLEGACTPADVEVFFTPDDHEPARDRRRRTRKALKLCVACPVRRRCLDYALADGQQFGIWGGVDMEARTRHIAAARKARRREARAS